MKLPRLDHDPAVVSEFFAEALQSCGALCEKTWHDRLAVVAEGHAARLWNEDGSLHEVELHFPSAEAAGTRDAARDVFPGCPLTFRLAGLLNPQPPTLERVVLAGTPGSQRPPSPEVAEKLWRTQWPETRRWRLGKPFAAGHHFSLLAVVRCEIQAIDQHWSLHRLAVSLPGGEPDESLAAERFLEAASGGGDAPSWPAPDPVLWLRIIDRAIRHELSAELTSVKERQARYLQRELARIDDYFEAYQLELGSRKSKGRPGADGAAAEARLEERRSAARAEHARRRQDQVHRHEIRVTPHLDALLLLAEPAWEAEVQVVEDRLEHPVTARFAPRNRRWYRHSGPTG